MRVTVTTWYLEMWAADELRQAGPSRLAVAVEPAGRDAALSRFFYLEVGRDWWWVDRRGWGDDQWRKWVERPGYELWVARLGDEPVGYLELDGEDGDVEVAYFGILPPYIGQGVGGHLLTVGVRAAWQRGASRVWLHTCSLDGPHALRNYEARGFRVYDTTTEEWVLSDRGAHRA